MIDFIQNNPVAAILAGMGLGKTASTLAALSFLLADGQIKAALIVAPLRVCNLTWPAELEKWEDFQWMKMVSLRTEAGWKAWEERSAQIYLINYDMLQQFALRGLKGAKSIPVDMIVWDELSFARNPSSKRINAIRPYRKFFKRHVGLTGTPASNSYMDLFGPFRLLDGGERLGMHITSYRNRYFDSDYMGYTYTLKDWAAKVIEEKIADITLTLRSQDWLHIPETVWEDVSVTLTPPLRKQYKELEKELLLAVRNREILAPNAAVLAGKLLQFTSGEIYDSEGIGVHIHDLKVEALKTLVKKINRPVIIAVAFVHEKTRILKAIPGAELFDEKRIDAWERGEIKAWVMHPASGGHGLNLQHGGDTTIWFSQNYSRDKVDQVNARTARTGQKNVTTVYQILAEDTIDWAVVAALKVKGDQQSGLLAALKNLELLRKTAA